MSNVKLKRALSTNLSDLLRYQNMLCRYDSMALKSLDVFSIHGFPIGQIQCESNLLGIEGDGVVIGSGGLLNIIDKFAKAKAYCTRPFEIRHEGQRKIPVFIEGEWIGEERNGTVPLQRRSVNLSCADAMQVKLRPAEFDAVLTDPPYFGNVQYAELMDFCYVWLRRLAGDSEPAFSNPTTRHRNELTENASMGRGVEHFSEGLSQAFQNVSRALKAGGPFVFTYHHNRFPAYLPLALAILDSGLTCSGSIPCPAEMGASIHINGTNSSIVDTVFVCRTTGRVPRRWIVANPNALAELICAELDNLRWAGMTPTQGDIRCIIFGHLIRLAVWNLRENWDKKLDTARRLELVAQWVSAFGGPEGVQQAIEKLGVHAPARQHFEIQESITDYAIDKDEIPF